MAHIHPLKDFVVTVVLVHKSKVLLCLHPRFGYWVPVGGHVELDEHPDQTLVRELREETGLEPDQYRILSTHAPCKIGSADVLNTPFLINHHPMLDPKFPDHYHISLVYVGATNTDKVVRSAEHQDLRWFSLSELRKIQTESVILAYCEMAIEAVDNKLVHEDQLGGELEGSLTEFLGEF